MYWLADIERNHNLAPRTIKPPPGPSSWRGEIDWETLSSEWMPLIGVAARPIGAAERYSAGTVQPYEISVRAYVQNAAADKPTRLTREVIRKKARALADKITPQKSTYANVRVHAEAAMMGLGCTFCTDSSAEQARAALGLEQAETDALKAVFTVCSLA